MIFGGNPLPARLKHLHDATRLQIYWTDSLFSGEDVQTILHNLFVTKVLNFA